MGAGAAGLGLAATVPSAASQDKKAAKTGGTRKMIIGADDVGYTNVNNLGVFETLDHGVVTTISVMVDTPGIVDALERAKAYPWVSVTWHTHFWGSPLLDPKKVPSLVMNDNGRIRFRKDLSSAQDVVFEEALMELRAEMDLCVKILGRALDHGSGGRGNAPFGRALKQVSEEYKMPINFARRQSFDKGVMKLSDISQVDEKWRSRNIITLDPINSGRDIITDSLKEFDEKYDPYKFYAEDWFRMNDLPEDAILAHTWHPGWLDWYVYALGDPSELNKNFRLARVKDVESLTSDRFKTWIKENRIELINYRDALYGTNEYQNHLKLIGSDLCMI